MIDTIKTTGWSEWVGNGFEHSITIEENPNNSFKNQISGLQREAYHWKKLYKEELKVNNKIKRIIQNPKKNATTVIFEDGEVVVIKRSAADPEADIYSIVAYAVAKKIYKTNSAFKRMVDETIVIPKKKKGDE